VTITPVKYIIYGNNLKSFDILSTCFYSYVLSNENLYPKLCELIKLCGRKLQFVFKVDYINLQTKQIPILNDNEIINLFENDKNDKQISGKKNKNKKSKQTKKSITTNETFISTDETSTEASISTDETSTETSISTDETLSDDISSETSIETFYSTDEKLQDDISTDDTLSDDLSSETSNETFYSIDDTSSNTLISTDEKLQDDISSKIKFNIQLKPTDEKYILKLLNQLYFDNSNFKMQMNNNDNLIITKDIHYDYNKHYKSKHFNGYFQNCDVKSSSYHFYIFRNKIYSITTINNLI
jgi:hypothetical protein